MWSDSRAENRVNCKRRPPASADAAAWQALRQRYGVAGLPSLALRSESCAHGAPSRDLITPHPLGGANMGRSAAAGVVDHRGEVFGYRNLFVADGAIVPEALGLNPSKTIAALAERIAELIVRDGR